MKYQILFFKWSEATDGVIVMPHGTLRTFTASPYLVGNPYKIPDRIRLTPSAGPSLGKT